MPQTGYTPIQIYSSSTPTNAPAAGDLVNDTKGSELAINIADKNLFFKDSTNAVNTVPIRQSGTSSNGWLSATDWNTFNNKQPAGAYVTGVTGTAPVVSSGGTTPDISMAAATTSVNGYLTSTDWNTFNNKQATLVSGTNIKTVGGVSLLGSGDVGTLGIAYGGTNATATPTAGGISYGTGTAYAFTAAGTTNYLLQSAGTGAPTWSNSINGITIGASTAANGTFSILNATTPKVTLSNTPYYHVIKTGEYDVGGGNQRPAAIVEGAWFIDTSNTDIAPVAVGASDKWRAIFIGAWGNYFDGFGVNGPGNYCEVTSDANTIAIGGTTVTITRNSTTGFLQWVSPSFQSQFQGTIHISSSGGAPVNAFNVKGGIRAVGVYSAVVGGTNRDLFVDDTGLIGYVSSTRESKTNIADVNNTSWLDALEPVMFNRRKKEFILGGENGREVLGEKYSEEAYDELEYGLIAEQAEKVNPELCFYDIVDGVKVLRGVHYSKLIIPILRRAQEQQQEIDQLKLKIAALEKTAL